MAHIKKNIEELAHYINKYRRETRILAAADLLYRCGLNRYGIHRDHELREQLVTRYGWSKTWYREFSSVASNRVLWKNRKNAPTSFLALFELSRSNRQHLATLFKSRSITPRTSGAKARALVAGNEDSRPISYPSSDEANRETATTPSKPKTIPSFFGAKKMTRGEKKRLNQKAAEIERLLKGTTENVLQAADECDWFVRSQGQNLPLLLKALKMSRSKFFKIRRCARIMQFGTGRASNLPRHLDALYRISQIKSCELKEALEHEIFSHRTTAPQIPRILAEFRAKKNRQNSK